MTIFQPIELNPDIPTNSFAVGKPIIPAEAQTRKGRFDEYHDLYRGDYRSLLYNEPELQTNYLSLISQNWFRRVSEFYAELLMAFPPEWDDELNALLGPALHSAIVDQTRFGAAIVHPLVVNRQLKFERIDPRYYYRLVDESQVAVTLLPEETFRLQRYANGLVVTQEGSLDATSIIQTLRTVAIERVPIDEPMLTVCPQLPTDGDFGMGIYADMAPLVLELIRRLSMNSVILNRHSRPRLVPWRTGSALNLDFSRERALARERQSVDKWNRRMEQMVLPLDTENYSKLEYLTWDGKLEASFTQIHETEEKLYQVTKMPPALQANLSSNPVPSGVALKRLYLATYVFIHSLQRSLLPCIQAVIANANRIGGKNYTIPTEWPNPFDVLASEEVDPNEGRGVTDEDDDGNILQ